MYLFTLKQVTIWHFSGCNQWYWLSAQNIIELLGFYLHNTYFSFQNKFYEQVEGVAMESPVSPIVVNLYMSTLKGKLSVPPLSPQAMDEICG